MRVTPATRRVALLPVFALMVVLVWTLPAWAQAPASSATPTQTEDEGSTISRSVSRVKFDASDDRQEPADAGTVPHTGFKALVRNTIGDFAHLPSKDSAICLAIGGAGLARGPSG